MKVAVIGAGVSGLISVKICREYGLDVVCFEKAKDIGGLWRYKPNECEGESSVMKTTIINTSKEMMAFSDFPPTNESPNFMHHEKVLAYFRSYAEHFNVMDFIRFEIEVKLVHRSPNFNETGQWDVTYVDLKTGQTTMETFDAVLLANGHHAETYSAKFKGLEKFKGRVIHSHSYKDHVGYEGKRVLVIGIGNSGGDIAVELSRIASQVYLVTRSGNWCLTRVALFGWPFDMAMQKRFLDWFLQRFPAPTNSLVEWFANLRFDHEIYGMQCNHRLFNQHPMVNDDLANRIASGTVLIKPNIAEFTETGVIFEDGTVAENLDEVLMCTGYTIGFPMLEKDLIKVDDNRLTLYKMIFPPQLKHQTLAVIGLIQPWGAIMPIAEMQARVVCESLTKRIRLPDSASMFKAAKDYNQKMFHRYGTSRRHTIQVDYLPYMDDLGSMIGAKPRALDFLFTDPKLAFQIVFGPAAPYQFRLSGPHPWPGARQALLTTWDRALYQMKHGRQMSPTSNKRTVINKFNFFRKIICMFFGLLFLWFMAILL